MLVVSADAYNSSRLATFVGLVVTSNVRLAVGPGNVLLPAGEGGLTYDSVVNVTQVVTVDKNDASELMGRIDPASMDLVEKGLRRVLGL